MKDLYHAINALKNILNEAPIRSGDGSIVRSGDGSPVTSGPKVAKPKAPKPAPAAPRPAAVSPTPGVGRQDGPGLPKPAAPKINPAVPAAGPVRANPINPQAMAATKAAASVVNAPKPAPAPKMAMPAPKPAAPAPRAKVKATAANTKDFDKTMALQKKLQAQGFDIKADGIMGKNTRAAMAAASAKKPTPASQVTPTAGDPGSQQSASPAPTGTARKVSTVAPGAAPAADDMMSPDDMMMQPVAKSNAALAGDVKKVARGAGEIAAGGRAGGILDKIGAGISSIFKPSPNSVIGKRGRNVARSAAPAGDFNFDDPKQNANAGGRLQTSRLAAPAGPNAAGSNFASAADGSISRTDNPRQPSDAAPATRTANRFDRATARMDRARDRKAARGDTTPVSVSDVQNAAAQSRAAVAATAAAPSGIPLPPTTRRSDTSFRASDGTNTVARDASGNLNVRQRVTDPDAKAALVSKVNRAREMQRLALAAGSTDPADIRAYQRRMANTTGTGAAGGTDMNTF